ncbi:MAG: putative zinc-binding metallopeptidase, partial [Pseudomonadota bacterium]
EPAQRYCPAGLAFDFLADQTHPDGTTRQHMTGHASGLITINIAEGDDAERERRRTQLGEPYRTLVGHFRHEVGHYYWDRLVAPDPALLAEFRATFGDERPDYAEALKRFYTNGPRPDWREHHISAYASAHPWEDFAETFAHFIHMVDGLETAAEFGLSTTTITDPYTHREVGDLIAAWVPTTVAVNAVNRSMGQPDLYPFVLSGPVRKKLAFLSRLLHAASPNPSVLSGAPPSSSRGETGTPTTWPA